MSDGTRHILTNFPLATYQTAGALRNSHHTDRIGREGKRCGIVVSATDQTHHLDKADHKRRYLTGTAIEQVPTRQLYK
jgi:hypothetical protein